MIRIPILLVGIVYACILEACLYAIAFVLPNHSQLVLMIGLPLTALLSSFMVGRWSQRPAPVPGLAIGILILAVRAGIGLGAFHSISMFIHPLVALLELSAAFAGGFIGTVLARREAEPVARQRAQTV